MKDSSYSDSSSYSSMLKRSQESCCTSSSSVKSRSQADEDEYIRFLETEVFKTEVERKRKEADAEHRLKLKERLALHEAKQRETELETKLKEEEETKTRLDKTLDLQEKRIRENEKKLVTLANLVKTTQEFAEEQEGLLKQTLDKSLEDVEERLRTMESKSAASSTESDDVVSCNNCTVEQAIQASPVAEEEEGEGEVEQREKAMGAEAVAQLVRDSMEELESRMQKRHEKQLKALNRRWEERLRMIESRLSEEYRERLKVLEGKVATKLEKVILKVGKTSSATARRAKSGASQRKATTAAHEAGPKVQEKRRASVGETDTSKITKHELASSLKALTRNVLEEMLIVESNEAQKENQRSHDASGIQKESGGATDAGRTSRLGGRGAMIPPSKGEAKARSKPKRSPKVSALRRSNIPNVRLPTTKVVQGGSKQERAREEYERRQERLEALYHEWTNLELESSSTALFGTAD
ncbi:hypothetical protein A3770_11p61590 [Chloropicon primus]|uniref:Uncharacterized protein n=1 Tax=Chloropicon primus TaxID=1764295 RepID=A0A5B8MTC2_9CHLO|nr:hypothetical protein A3770_11p61590 [Chloropicon primus]|eukprot:QDZ23641.1 hypothetical protein A3770_11p61590 [Chloropicon primus]